MGPSRRFGGQRAGVSAAGVLFADRLESARKPWAPESGLEGLAFFHLLAFLLFSRPQLILSALNPFLPGKISERLLIGPASRDSMGTDSTPFGDFPRATIGDPSS